jgi:flavin-dependent thymidylate synthase
MSEPGKDLRLWADVAMFKAAPIDKESGPRVQLLSCNSDPLGTIAAAAKMYKGEYVESLAQISDQERKHYLEDVRKNVLAAPLEFVNFHFLISGVTRGFTHQMVRQRTATYTQESTRFAVKEDVPVGRPPSLAGTVSWDDWLAQCGKELYPNQGNRIFNPAQQVDIQSYAETNASKEQIWRREWDEQIADIGTTYNSLVNSGMPAEDARGLLPTNLLTRINYNTSLRGLLEHAGLRLCTQAQFEWRLVWLRIIEAIREYGKTQRYEANVEDGVFTKYVPSDWQFEELSKIFKPICYQKGSCQFLSDVDRACTIRDRVQAFAAIGAKSDTWDSDMQVKPHPACSDDEFWIKGIRTEEWLLDPTSARVSQ